MFKLFEIGTSLFECLLVHIFFHNWFGRREVSRAFWLLIFFGYFCTNIILTLAPLPPLIRSALSLICVTIIVRLLYQNSTLSALLGSVLYMCLAVIAEYLTMVVMNALSFDTVTLMETGKVRAVYIVFAKLIHLVLVLVISSILSKNRGPLKFLQVLPLLPCQIISMYICHVLYTASQHVDDLLSGRFVVVLLGLLYMNLISVEFIQNIAARANLQQEKELAEQNYLLQQAYYAQVQKDQVETHALWHDIKKYVLAIQASISEHNNNDSIQILQHLQDEFSSLGNIVDVENPELNVILNYCVQKASAAGIHVTMDVSVPHTLPVSAVDLSIIIGNTVDNAIEACQALERKDSTIDIMLRLYNRMLFYTVDNPCPTKPMHKDSKNHGYGLQNVTRCVQKYHGTLLTERKDGFFHVSVRLSLPSEKSNPHKELVYFHQ